MMTLIKKWTAATMLVIASFTAVPAANAAETIYTRTLSNKAVSGYDTVAYFLQSKAVKGSSQFATEYKGVMWLFSSQANLDAFKAKPDKYAPQYGGYCAYAVGAKNSLVSSDPEAWKIVDGKLYLNYDKDIQAEWLLKQADYIKLADANWPNLNK